MCEGCNLCQRCGAPLQGPAELCVRCYDWAVRPCPNCMRQTANGKYKVVTAGVKKILMDCVVCNNGRWVKYDYVPFSATAERDKVAGVFEGLSKPDRPA